MRLARDRLLNVIATVEAVRERHAEFRKAVTWDGLRRVFAREQIRLLRLPIMEQADVVAAPPHFVITISTRAPTRNLRRLAAHEYAHVRLHFGEPGEFVKQLSPCGPDDVREREAELFAAMLLIGPSATPDHPKIRPLVAA